METNVITFEITVPFNDWAKAYDASISTQKEAGLESLFRGVSKDDSTKCVVLIRAEPGALDKFMEANSEMVAASGHVLDSTIITTYLEG